MTDYVFMEPLDVLYLRGNRSFGAPGDHAAALMPPWPSLAAGALRSRMLTDSGLHPSALKQERLPDAAWNAVLGTLSRPGSFRLSAFGLARRNGHGAIEALHPCPADLVVTSGKATYLRPEASDLPSGGGLGTLAVLASEPREKPQMSWLTAVGWSAYLAGRPIAAAGLVDPKDLWKTDARVGVGLDPDTRAARQGQLFSTDTVALAGGVGLLAGVSGAGGKLPRTGLVRLGGDGRAARLSAASLPARNLAPLAAARQLRLVLTSPGLFLNGWRLPGLSSDGVWDYGGVRARLVAAAVPRAAIVSGWDLANWIPKPALRAVPAGAVYWFDDVTATAADLAQIETAGVWDEPDHFSAARTRRAEGFNACVFAPWAA